MNDLLKIDLDQKNIQQIKDKKITLVKNFVNFKQQYDFNTLIDFIEKSDVGVLNKDKQENVFKNNFCIKKVENNFNSFAYVLNFLKKVFNYPNTIDDEADIFFSFKSNSGLSHVDREDVFIIGLYGTTIYKIIDEKGDLYQIKKGDMVYIPRGIPHKVISLSERIVLAIGLFGNQQIDKT